MTTLLDSAGPWLLAITALSWKGALLAFIVGLSILIMRRRLSPAWRHGLWLLVLVRLAVPDLVTSPWAMSRWIALPRSVEAQSTSITAPRWAAPPPPLSSAPVDPSFMAEAPVAAASAGEVVASNPMRVSTPWTSWQWLTMVWLLGVGLVIGVMVVLHLRMGHRVRCDRTEPSTNALASLSAACEQAQLKRVPALIITDAVRAPALFGIVRPAVLLPRELVVSCDAASLNLILLHEIAHLQRRDLWAQVAASLIIALHWFNPVVWWAGRRLRAEAEMAADARALRYTDASEAHRMGEVLLGFANHAATGWMVWFAAATVLGISANKRDLRRRIEALMDLARGRRPWWLMGLAAFVALTVTGLTKAPAVEAKKSPANTTTVAGSVVDDQGKPVQGASCSLKIGERKDIEVRKATSDAQGHFQFEAVPVPSKLSLSGHHNGYMEANPTHFSFSSVKQEEHQIVLPRATGWVSGTVTRKADGTPVKDAQVYVGSQTTIPMPMFFWVVPRKVNTDQAGHYRVANWSAKKKDGMVVVDAPGMALTVATFVLKEGEVTVDQALEPDAGVTGTVVNAEGRPVQGAVVCLSGRFFHNVDAPRPARESAPRLSDRSFFHDVDVITTMKPAEGDSYRFGDYWMGKSATDEKGAFAGRSADPRSADEQWLIVHHPTEGIQRVRLKDWKQGGTMKLEHWNTVHGRLADQDGNAIKGAKVKFMDHELERDDMDKVVFSIMHTTSTTSDEQGHYKLDQILPHSYGSFVSVDGKSNSSTSLNLGSGETQEFNIRLRAKEVMVPNEHLRKMTGRVVMPSGHALRSDDYDVVATIGIVGSGMAGRLFPDEKGRFETTASQPGNYKLRITVDPKDTKKFQPAANGGVSMLIKLEPDSKQQALDLGDFALDAADFVFHPPSQKAAQPRPMQRLNATVAGAASFATWAGSNGGGFSPETPLTAEGRIVGSTMVSTTHRFIIRGTKADGSRHFSAPQIAGEDSDKAIESTLSFTPAVVVEGRMLGLPADCAGDGWIVASVGVNAEVKPGTIVKGAIPAMPWFAWAPVQRDGRLRFAALPHGRLTLAGFANGWITRDPLNISTFVQVGVLGAEPVFKVNLDTKPCVTKRVRLIRPDDTPAAGATISIASDSVYNNPAFVRRSHDFDSADAEAYKRYKKVSIPGHSAIADADGYATLGNQAQGQTTCDVKWTDPRTNAVHQEKVDVVNGLSPYASRVVKLTGKSE